LFGSLWPDAQHAIFPANPEQKALIEGIAQFGILLLLLLTGMETDLKLVRKVGRPALFVSVAGIVCLLPAAWRSDNSCLKACSRIRRRAW
jgi:Kef-type K+ transport system membrane component KefB